MEKIMKSTNRKRYLFMWEGGDIAVPDENNNNSWLITH